MRPSALTKCDAEMYMSKSTQTVAFLVLHLGVIDCCICSINDILRPHKNISMHVIFLYCMIRNFDELVQHFREHLLGNNPVQVYQFSE